MRLLFDLARGMMARRVRQTLVSVFGVALGVAFFVAIAALMRGFQVYFITQMIDVAPHVTIKDETRSPPVQAAALAIPGEAAVEVRNVRPPERNPRGIRAAGDKLAALEAIPGVSAAPSLTAQALLRYGGRDIAASITGIDPARQVRVSNIEKDMTVGRLDDLRATANGVIMGVGLAERLGVGMGDSFGAVSPRGVVLSMRVVGLFRTGIMSLDQSQGYALLKVAQVLQDRPDAVNRIEVRLADVTQAEPFAREVEARFGDRAESWEEQNRNILTVFVIQNAVMYSVTGAILLVAAFGIYNVVSTVVFEKTRDIAILKSLGLTARDVQVVFLLQGIAAGLVGAAVGCALGAIMVEGLGLVRFGNATTSGNDRFTLAREPVVYMIAAAFAVLASALASLLPARRAARLDPVQVVRGAA